MTAKLKQRDVATGTAPREKEELPTVIRWHEVQLDKPANKFTKADWELAAMNAAGICDELVPLPKPRGRPRKLTTLGELMRKWATPSKPKRRGRPLQTYGRHKFNLDQIRELINEIVDEIACEISKPNRDLKRLIVERLVPRHSVDSVMRGLRKRKQIAKKS